LRAASLYVLSPIDFVPPQILYWESLN